MNLKERNKLLNLLETIDHAHQSEETVYEFEIVDHKGTRTEYGDREYYLEFILDITYEALHELVDEEEF
ncbi:hypothetical protein FLK61_34290 [Paenalkalicoccus suaedae]|uniref:Uncharacterized protein n=1 Tax=Paenalkalicoccus suaedae TaxID=2592382 RepID=A0A859FGC3_9BACI|nr:hypothetical protein [Paenalkalicoccus suaedae]QKS71694.1 hypothetical protein FLK61_33995 [Paenalkalicoccus suaedae]QKS71748.1 hypothetical protein FLK61_34290 [Paenalkalicoccus suaedae]